jgi:hypothetical protein
VSENVHKTLIEAGERQDAIDRGHRITSVAVAVIAVLAALGTLFSHHRSISALTAKNQAILTQARASDAYNKFEAKRIRSQIVYALIQSGVPQTEQARKTLQTLADTESQSSLAFQKKANTLEAQADDFDHQSERILKSYETLEIATTFFEIAIILVSISTLVQTRWFVTAGCTLSVVGLAFLIFGFFQGH